jgi:hypothetical protein
LLLHVTGNFGHVNVVNFFDLKPCSHIINAAEELKSSFGQAVAPEEETGDRKQPELSSAEGSASSGCSQA